MMESATARGGESQWEEESITVYITQHRNDGFDKRG